MGTLTLPVKGKGSKQPLLVSVANMFTGNNPPVFVTTLSLFSFPVAVCSNNATPLDLALVNVKTLCLYVCVSSSLFLFFCLFSSVVLSNESSDTQCFASLAWTGVSGEGREEGKEDERGNDMEGAGELTV